MRLEWTLKQRIKTQKQKKTDQKSNSIIEKYLEVLENIKEFEKKILYIF